MKSIAYISFGLALRLFVSATPPGDNRIGNAAVGLIEGAVLQRMFNEAGRSPSQLCIAYVRFVFCLLAGYVFTRSWTALVVVMLSAGVGMLLYDVVHTLRQRPRSRCKHCQLKTKASVSLTPRRRAPVSNTKSTLPQPVSDRDISAAEPGMRILGAALLPDSIDELEHILPGTSEWESPTPPTPTPAPESYRVATMTPDPEPQMPNSALSSRTIGDDLGNLSFLLRPSISSEAPYACDLQRILTPRTVSPEETRATTPLSEATLELITGHDEQRTSTSIREDSIPPIPSTFPTVEQMSGQSNDNKVSAKAFSASWDDLASEASPPSSVLSVDGREDLISHADLMRRLAVDADQRYIRLEADRKQALEEGRIKEAFLLRDQIKEAEIMSKRLHERAERRYYRAHNLKTKAREIDAHGLRVRETLLRVERALRDMLLQGDTDLRVIVGRGNHSVNKIPILKMAVLKAMRRHGIPACVDPSNPGVVIITLPS